MNDETPIDAPFWIIKRYVVEHIQAQGLTREEAINNANANGDPCIVFVTKVTAKKQKS